jgi:polysaccharide deacetylase family protein (PEP-CTERM system associated)
VQHFFTVDVEEYFQVVALERVAPREGWDTHPRRAAEATRRLLDVMARRDARGTFFTVGWLAEREPGLMREIAAAGHELASHTWDHKQVTRQTPDAFRESVRRTKRLLEDQTGQRVVGFRAPSFSITRGQEWALDVLLEEGYTYDSSLFPVRRRGYGYAGGPRDPYWIHRPSGRLAEFPPVTWRVLGATLPAAGGAYLRLLPEGLVSTALRQSARRGAPGTVYTHPWEWDPGQPRFDVPFLTRIRHYGGLAGVLARLDRLLQVHRFTSIISLMDTRRDAVDPVTRDRAPAAAQPSPRPH